MSNADGVYLLWAGNGHLKIDALRPTLRMPSYDPGRTVTASERADAASGVVTTYTRGDVIDAYVVRVISGSAFSLSAFEIANNRALVWPMANLPVATINGGLAPPYRPAPLKLDVDVREDSTIFSAHGLGFERTTQVFPLPSGSRGSGVPYLVQGDTLVVIAMPTSHAALVEGFQFQQSDRAGARIAAASHWDDFLKVLPYQVLVRLGEDAGSDVLATIDGVMQVALLGPDASNARVNNRGPLPEDLSGYRVLTIRAKKEVGALLDQVRALPSVADAALVGPGPRPSTDPNDLLWNEQWSLHQVGASFCGGWVAPVPNSSINMPAAWQLPAYPPDIRIGIIDTGLGSNSIDASQYDPDVPAVSYAPLDPLIDDNTPEYPHHGTAVSSIAAARTNNIHGIAAPAYDQEQATEPPFGAGMPVAIKWLGVHGGNWSSVKSCLNHVTNEPTGRIRIANMSFDGGPPGPFEQQVLVRAVKNAFLSGALLVASAGNSNDSDRTYPGIYDDYVLAVGACLWNNMYWTNVNASPFVPQSDSTANASKWGSWVDVVAPGGVGIAAAKNVEQPAFNPYAAYFTMQNSDPVNQCNMYDLNSLGFGGTSASAPVVSGVAAWLLRLRPSLTGEDAGQVILRTATDMGAPGFDVRFGNGRVNAGAAASFVSTPNWVHHGVVGAGGQSPLVAGPDSLLDATIVLTNAEGIIDGPHSCVKYHLTGQATFDAGFLQVPTTWIRRADTQGIANVVAWDDDERAPWAGITGVTAADATVETFVYRLTDAGNRWYPVAPDLARVAYTAIGPSGTLDAGARLAKAELTLRCRPGMRGRGMRFEVSGLKPGPGKIEIFDIAGRRVAEVWRGISTERDMAVEWAGEGNRGLMLARGVYVCRVTQLGLDVAKRFAWYR